MKLIYDGNMLVNWSRKDSSRSGIFFVAWNIFKGLLTEVDEICLYVDVQNMNEVRRMLNKEFVDWHIKILFEDYQWIKFLANIMDVLKSHKCVRDNFFFKGACFCINRICNFFLKHFQKANRVVQYYDIYFSPDKMYPAFIKKNQSIKKFIFLHDMIPFKFPEYFPMMRKGYIYWHKTLVKFMNSKDFYIANSQCTKRDFLEYLNGKVFDEQIKVVPLACDEKFVYHPEQKLEVLNKYGIPANKKYIFCLCSLEPRKNLLRAMQCFVKFLEKNEIEDLIFVLGGGQWRSFKEKFDIELRKNSKWERQIFPIGYVDDEDLPYLYSHSEWFVYTSQYEGFGLPVLEAMSCGCPIVTSNNSSLPEVVEDVGIQITWDSDKEHIEAFEKYYYDKTFRDEERKKGLEQAKKFTWENTVKKIYLYLCEKYEENA